LPEIDRQRLTQSISGSTCVVLVCVCLLTLLTQISIHHINKTRFVGSGSRHLMT